MTDLLPSGRGVEQKAFLERIGESCYVPRGMSKTELNRDVLAAKYMERHNDLNVQRFSTRQQCRRKEGTV